MRRYQRIQRPWRRWDDLALRRGLGVYVHVPYCLKRCGYCDFLSYGPAGPNVPPPARYAELLGQEIERRGAWMRAHYGKAGRRVDSVFFGGGTPTYLAPDALAGLVRAVLEHYPCDLEAVEVTVEANPDTLSAEYVAALASAGVNRLSIGIQATQERHLRFLGRTHRWRDIEPLLARLSGGPIQRLSFDLIYGMPGLTPSELSQTVRRLLNLGAEHISAYELTIEEGTPLAHWARRFPGQLASSDLVSAQQHQIERLLAGHGLYRYEVSNYARPGAECRHNLRYWRGGDYIGLGAGAASRINETVLNNAPRFEDYERAVELACSAGDPLVAECARQAALGLSADIAPAADAFLRLRTRAGIPAVTGSPLKPQWLSRGWSEPYGTALEITSRGLNFADALARELE